MRAHIARNRREGGKGEAEPRCLLKRTTWGKAKIRETMDRKINPILTKAQWKKLEQQFVPVRRGGGIQS